MNIEISPKEYWKYLNYYDSELYCSLLVIDGKNDWRLRKIKEELNLENFKRQGVWYQTTDYFYGFEFIINLVIPVRDV